jgi:DNA invertase Pin-like site-specific DNA recombinase
MPPASSNRPVRAAIYARVSTTHHGQDVGLQIEELYRVAEQRGWEVVGVYQDEGISGAKSARPALDRMLEDAARGRLDVIAVWKLDRLARSVLHLLDIAAALNTWGVGLVSVRDAHVDTTTPGGRFTLQILGAVAELERSLIQERVVAGVRRAQAQGKHCGRPRREVDLRPALALGAQGHGLKSIAKMLGLPRSTLRRRLAEEGYRVAPDGGVQNPTLGESL